MSETKSSVKVDVGASAKLNVELKTEVPKESSGRLLDSLTDLIRPFSEKRGLKAGRLRLEREEVLYEIAVRARKRIELERTAVTPIPNKFLIPLLERASLEDLSDKKLLDMWSNLLATALTQKVELLGQYTDILSHLTGGQARLFEEIVSKTLPTDGSKTKTGHFIDQYYYLNQTGLPGSLQKHSALKRAKSFAKRVWEEIDGIGVAIDTVSIYDNEKSSNDVTFLGNRNLYRDELFLDFENLCRLGLLDKTELKNVAIGRYSVDAIYYLVTPVGIDLFACCNPTHIERQM
jgi:hypothetical protein